jgi:Fibronectin type III-like domain
LNWLLGRYARVGDEVVQLYVRDDVSSVPRPILELKAFERVTVKPREMRTVHFDLGPDALAFLGYPHAMGRRAGHLYDLIRRQLGCAQVRETHCVGATMINSAKEYSMTLRLRLGAHCSVLWVSIT